MEVRKEREREREERRERRGERGCRVRWGRRKGINLHVTNELLFLQAFTTSLCTPAEPRN